MLPVVDTVQRGEVIRRQRDHNGRPVGLRNSNPILDTREYAVQFPDGTQQLYMANVITENLYSQIDSEGHSFAILQDIIGHKKDASAISQEDESVRYNFTIYETNTETGYETQICLVLLSLNPERTFCFSTSLSCFPAIQVLSVTSLVPPIAPLNARLSSPHLANSMVNLKMCTNILHNLPNVALKLALSKTSLILLAKTLLLLTLI